MKSEAKIAIVTGAGNRYRPQYYHLVIARGLFRGSRWSP